MTKINLDRFETLYLKAASIPLSIILRQSKKTIFNKLKRRDEALIKKIRKSQILQIILALTLRTVTGMIVLPMTLVSFTITKKFNYSLIRLKPDEVSCLTDFMLNASKLFRTIASYTYIILTYAEFDTASTLHCSYYTHKLAKLQDTLNYLAYIAQVTTNLKSFKGSKLEIEKQIRLVLRHFNLDSKEMNEIVDVFSSLIQHIHMTIKTLQTAIKHYVKFDNQMFVARYFGLTLTGLLYGPKLYYEIVDNIGVSAELTLEKLKTISKKTLKQYAKSTAIDITIMFVAKTLLKYLARRLLQNKSLGVLIIAVLILVFTDLFVTCKIYKRIISRGLNLRGGSSNGTK